MEENQNAASNESTEKVTATVETNKEQNNQTQQTSTPESKTLIGALCGVFIGLIGLVIGLLLYKDGSYERKTFIKGWLWAFVIAAVVEVIATIVIISTVSCAAIYAPEVYY